MRKEQKPMSGFYDADRPEGQAILSYLNARDRPYYTPCRCDDCHEIVWCGDYDAFVCPFCGCNSGFFDPAVGGYDPHRHGITAFILPAEVEASLRGEVEVVLDSLPEQTETERARVAEETLGRELARYNTARKRSAAGLEGIAGPGPA
jgi:hypothetical protein